MGRVWSRFGSGILQDLFAISPPVGCVRRGGPWLRHCTLLCAACPLEFSPSLIDVLLFGSWVKKSRGVRGFYHCAVVIDSDCRASCTSNVCRINSNWRDSSPRWSSFYGHVI